MLTHPTAAEEILPLPSRALGSLRMTGEEGYTHRENDISVLILLFPLVAGDHAVLDVDDTVGILGNVVFVRD